MISQWVRRWVGAYKARVETYTGRSGCAGQVVTSHLSDSALSLMEIFSSKSLLASNRCNSFPVLLLVMTTVFVRYSSAR